MVHQYTQKKIHQQRDDLTGEHVVGDAGQIVLACLFAATWIADTFFFKYTTFLNQYAPLGARIPSGVVLLVLQAPPAKTSRSIVFGFLHYISRYEERLLLVHFGEDYEKYMGEGPVWFPRIRKR